MNLIAFGLAYVEWHYTRGLQNLFRIVSNFFLFVVHFFSIPALAATLFSPWRRLAEERQHQYLDLEEIASVFIVNTLMRIVGFCFRVVTITLGFVALVLVVFGAVLAVVLWLAWPLVMLTLFVNGLYLLIV